MGMAALKEENVQMKFSIVIPVYNVEEYLGKCIESILCQSFRNFEVIIVDDGAIDISAVLCENCLQDDCRFKVIHKTNGGLSDARNFGIKVAVGEYLLFLDSDDYWSSPDALELINKRISKTQPDVLSVNYCKDVDGTISAPYYSVGRSMNRQDDITFMIDNSLWSACACNKIAKTELLQSNNLFFIKGINAEDMDWCARLASLANSMDYYNLILFHYRFRTTSISHSTDTKGVRQLCANLLYIKTITEDADESKQPLLESYLGFLVGVLLLNISHISNKAERNQILDEASVVIPYLEKAKSKKMQFINRIKNIAGIKTTVFLLGLKK